MSSQRQWKHENEWNDWNDETERESMDKEGDTMRENGNSRGNGKLETYLVIQYMSTYP